MRLALHSHRQLTGARTAERELAKRILRETSSLSGRLVIVVAVAARLPVETPLVSSFSLAFSSSGLLMATYVLRVLWLDQDISSTDELIHITITRR